MQSCNTLPIFEFLSSSSIFSVNWFGFERCTIWVGIPLHFVCLYLSVLFSETLKCWLTVDWLLHFCVYTFCRCTLILWNDPNDPRLTQFQGYIFLLHHFMISFLKSQFECLINWWGMSYQSTTKSPAHMSLFEHFLCMNSIYIYIHFVWTDCFEALVYISNQSSGNFVSGKFWNSWMTRVAQEEFYSGG